MGRNHENAVRPELENEMNQVTEETARQSEKAENQPEKVENQPEETENQSEEAENQIREAERQSEGTEEQSEKVVNESEKIAMKVSVNSIIVNVLLSLFKLIAGLAGRSGAMVSDAVHSISDVLSTFVVMAGVKLAGKKSDHNHQYGHERMECVAAIILAVFLAATGLGIGYGGLVKIVEGDYGDLSVPGLVALVMALVSVAVKEAMYWYTRHAAKKINSGALMADAWHHRSDAMSSIGSFAGILGARLGFPVLDPVASVVICVFIIKAAADIFIDAVRKMTDESCDDKTVEQMRGVILSQKDVLGLDDIRTRMFGSKVYVDIEICADGEKTLNETHKIAETVHEAIEREFTDVKHCMVHVNPAKG